MEYEKQPPLSAFGGRPLPGEEGEVCWRFFVPLKKGDAFRPAKRDGMQGVCFS